MKFPLRNKLEDSEYYALCEFFELEWNLEKFEITELINSLYVAVWDNYISDGPGYSGKVLVVIGPGGPELLSCFTFDKKGKLRQENIQTH